MAANPLVTPPWVTVTPYLIGARVTPTVPDGTNWYATVAGTSGASEPTWPTAEPWTVVDGTVTWRLATAFRQNAIAGVLRTLHSFRDANPWALKGIKTARPENLAKMDLPGCYIADASETIVHANGIRTRTISGLSVMLVLNTPANNEASDASDVIIDALMDAFTAAFHSADGSSITAQTSVTEVALDDDGGHYLGQLITLGATSKAEGRN